MPKISSRDGGRPAQRTVNPIIVTRRGKIARLESGLTSGGPDRRSGLSAKGVKQG